MAFVGPQDALVAPIISPKAVVSIAATCNSSGIIYVSAIHSVAVSTRITPGAMLICRLACPQPRFQPHYRI